MDRCASCASSSEISPSKRGWLPARFETIRIECGFVVWLNGEVSEVRREESLARICGGKDVVFAAQSVLSLSSTRARIVGVCGVFSGVGICVWGPFFPLIRCGPRFSGRWVKVGMVRCGRNWVGCLRRVWTAWLKPRRLELGEPAIMVIFGDI